MKIRLLLASLICLTGLMFTTPAALAWSPFQGACSGGGANGSAVCSNPSNGDPIAGPNGILMKITNLIAIVGGIAAIIVIMLSGYKYITSAGNSSSLESARNTLLYAVVGLIVIILGRTIIAYVVSHV